MLNIFTFDAFLVCHSLIRQSEVCMTFTDSLFLCLSVILFVYLLFWLPDVLPVCIFPYLLFTSFLWTVCPCFRDYFWFYTYSIEL